MRDIAGGEEKQSARIVLGILDSVDRNGEQSQRRLASELGIAVGLVNAYLKRCVNKGLVKVRTAPMRRYAYYLTPKGLAEKSRLTVDYFSSSFSFFRQARADCAKELQDAHRRGCRTVALIGISDLAEIAILCAMEAGITVAAVVDADAREERFIGIPVQTSLDGVAERVDAVVATNLVVAQAAADAAIAAFGPSRVLIPALLNVGVYRDNGAAAV